MVYDYLMEVGDRQGKFMDAGKTRYLVDNLNSHHRMAQLHRGHREGR